MTDTHLPLENIRVLDVSTVIAAPVAATFLGDFGADVVKVEEPGKGDFLREGAGSDSPGRRSLQWVQEGRNKRSVTVDLRREEGQQILRDLVPHFDVVITNYRPPTLEKWGLGPDALSSLNPRAILTFVTGYGLTGPYRDRGAFDRIASAFSGLTYVTGEADREPVRSGYSVIDYLAGYLAAFATVTALYERDLNGGSGQVIDLGLYEAGFRASENSMMTFSALGTVRERIGNRHPNIVPASDFDTADGRRISLHAGTDTLFRKLSSLMGRPALAQDERFATRPARTANQDELYPIVIDWVAEHKAAELVDQLNDAGVPASLLMNVADIAENEHYLARKSIVTTDDEYFGAVTMPGPIPHLSRTPGRIRHLGPALGEHTDQLLTELLGTDPAVLADLHAKGVI